ncbi:tripartite tricarboxylate transporter permease [Cohaesibacter gelatinilyticus]|uniref:Putative tricarboxylic transport membrane protein n=1 Tax=Cohaesibacter gelatinilyticus TaxID=372072 RepID=A0A285PFK1_9HYPH|nr:tripartite tricarboxylate transporter permease [Cohaesibacter gelatinilyticus]SNZ20218.1 putative tricarboxylic transport membrane protein [Cohaesibacter gelatinilyticus]
MVPFDVIMAGLSGSFAPMVLLYIFAGVVIGQFVGAVPGIGPIMAIAIAIPFTFVMDPLVGIAFLVGIGKGGLVGGAVPAVLINTPGTPDAAATALDGFPLARQGKPLKAMRMALYSSVTGDTVSDIVLITISAPLAIVALQLGPVEILFLLLFAFTVIVCLVGGSVTKGAIALLLGLLFATIGLDPEYATPRLVFGFTQLYDGVPLEAIALGILVMPEVLRRLADGIGIARPAVVIPDDQPKADKQISWVEYWECRFAMMRGASIGTLLGALPGIGSTAAAFISYASTKESSDDPKSFGRGNIAGIAAAESANSAVVGANLIPLLTLGIPGSVGAALLIGAFKIHGIQPGPLLFKQQAELIYGLFGAMIIANFFNFWVGQVGMRVWATVVKAPEAFIFSIALLLCIVGVYLGAGGMFGIYVMLICTVIGLALTAAGYSVIVFIIAFFLGSRFETTISQAYSLTEGHPAELLNYPVAVALLAVNLCFLFLFARKRFREGKNARERA